MSAPPPAPPADTRPGRLASARRIAWRVARFGLVGVLATLTHAGVSLAALRWGHFPPLGANAAGFCLAFVVSFCGHAFFTFDAPPTLGRAVRFTAVALTSALLSSGLVLAAQTWTSVRPDVYLPLVALFTPVFNFVVHSLWTFRRAPGIVD